MSKHLFGLNDAQVQAVIYDEGPLAIIASAGSGKTRVITHKIGYLIEDLLVSPHAILAVTFTNKATNEMRERLKHMVDDASKVWIYTYHALCARILRQDIEHLGYHSKFNILDTIDQRQLLGGVYRTLDISQKTITYTAAINYISHKKMDGVTFAEAIDDANNDTERMYAQVYKGYCQTIERIKSLDFDDLLLFTHRLFKEHPQVAAKWAACFDHVLVDEFQDTSFVQYEIVRTLAQKAKITIVGDPDQTIYTWRRADVSLINNFDSHFPGAKIIKLEHNYRSTKTILDKANALIKHNRRRIDKSLKATIADGDSVEFYHGFSDDAEARWIAKRINELRKDRTQLRDIAILYRANYLSAPIEKALITDNIKYIIFGGIRFYQREEIKDAICYLRIIASGDEVALKRMINIPARKLGSGALETIYTQHDKSKSDLWTFLVNEINALDISVAQKHSLAAFINLIHKYRLALKTNPIALVLEKFIIEVGYMGSLSPIEDIGRIENLKELYKVIANWQQENPTFGIDEYLEQTSLLLDRDDSGASDFVTLMTVHNAKGLEFRNVFIAGFSESVFPSARALEEDAENGLEEERRLAYVAVTRAKERLFISDSRGYSIDHRFQKKPSRFLKEMGINPREFTSEFIAPSSIDDNYVETDRSFIVGDEAVHITFGTGVVVAVHGELIDIAFKAPHGVKTLMKNHKSLQKVGDE